MRLGRGCRWWVRAALPNLPIGGQVSLLRGLADRQDNAARSVVAAALESGAYRPSSVIDTAPGYVVVGAKTIKDSRNLGQISLTTILARSSNVGVTKLAMTLKPDQLWDTMTQFGLGTLTATITAPWCNLL